MAAAKSFGSPVFVFVAFTVLFCHLIFSDLHQQLTKITARSFTENQTPPSSCSERKVIIQLGNLISESMDFEDLVWVFRNGRSMAKLRY